MPDPDARLLAELRRRRDAFDAAIRALELAIHPRKRSGRRPGTMSAAERRAISIRTKARRAAERQAAAPTGVAASTRRKLARAMKRRWRAARKTGGPLPGQPAKRAKRGRDHRSAAGRARHRAAMLAYHARRRAAKKTAAPVALPPHMRRREAQAGAVEGKTQT